MIFLCKFRHQWLKRVFKLFISCQLVIGHGHLGVANILELWLLFPVADDLIVSLGKQARHFRFIFTSCKAQGKNK